MESVQDFTQHINKARAGVNHPSGLRRVKLASNAKPTTRSQEGGPAPADLAPLNRSKTGTAPVAETSSADRYLQTPE